MNNPMLDKDFLKELDNMKHKEIYARLTALNFLERPIEQIEGRITGGSINLDGASSSRRTCSLSMVAKDVNINQFYWGLTTKIQIEVGIVNTINPAYDRIIWFNQGKFVITTFNVAYTANNYTISVNAKDKMSLLNGDLGGSLTAQTDFAKIDNYNKIYDIKVFNNPNEYEANKYYVYDDETDTYSLSTDEYRINTNYYELNMNYSMDALPLKTIIREAVHTYAKEPYFNIIINDLEDYGVELLEYRGDQPMYLLLDIDQDVYTNITLNGDIPCDIVDEEGNILNQDSLTLSDLGPEVLDPRITGIENDTIVNRQMIQFSNDKKYYVSKINYGDTAGFRTTDLVYAGELIGNIGESLTSVLDKIKNMLGDFEYFYDVDGRFIFQRQKIYESQSWNTITETADDDLLIENAATSSPVAYSFINNNIITAFNNNPNLGNLRNDFSIWGVRKGVGGGDIPIHLRYAIDKKPTYYKTFDGTIYTTREDLFDKLKEEYVVQARKEFYGFQRKPNPHYAGKEQLSDDWWYMSDWYNYYKKLTGQAPTDYIRFYATNRANEAGELGYVPNFNPELYFNTRGTATHRNVWLFHLINGVYVYGNSDQHNSSGNSIRVETSDGSITGSPFNGCTAHTYRDFVLIDEDDIAYDKPGSTGFFYKPHFPSEEIEHFIEENAEVYVQEYLNEHCVLCDWREIIYQMALDYYKHNQDDDFYSQIMINNGRNDNGDFYYPNGSTGYEQYYTDMAAFWRDLYNINPEQTYYSQGGYYTETINWSQQEDLTFETQVVWVPYEEKDTLFESAYYLDETLKKYKDTEIDDIYYIESQNIELQLWTETAGNQTNTIGITWTADPSYTYEIYRSFYPSSGFASINSQPPEPSENNVYTFKEVGLTTIGSDASLDLYYRVRGYKDISVGGGTKRFYTQWSNRCSLTYILDKEQNQIVIKDGHQYNLLSTEQIPMTDKSVYNSNYVQDNRKYWNKKVFESPELLNFWIDFLDSDSELAQFAVPVVGDRPKAVNDTKVTSIYFKETPNIIFTTEDEYDPFERQTGYTYIWLNSQLENLFSISSQQKSAKDVLDEYLYKHSYCIESVTVTTIPIYYLEPNTRVLIYDEASKINGEYIISKITLPLAYNGTMSITATKAVNRIY